MKIRERPEVFSSLSYWVKIFKILAHFRKIKFLSDFQENATKMFIKAISSKKNVTKKAKGFFFILKSFKINFY